MPKRLLLVLALLLALAIQVSAQADPITPDLIIDDFEDVVKATPLRVGIAQQNVLAWFERAFAFFDRDFFERIAGIDASVGIAGQTHVFAVGGFAEPFFEAGEKRRRNLIEHVPAREKAFPHSVIADDALIRIQADFAVVDHGFDATRLHAVEQALKLRLRVVEVPVVFRHRMGTSKGVGANKLKAARVALRMLGRRCVRTTQKSSGTD